MPDEPVDNREAEIRKRIEEEYGGYSDSDAKEDGYEDRDDMIEELIADELDPARVTAGMGPDGDMSGLYPDDDLHRGPTSSGSGSSVDAGLSGPPVHVDAGAGAGTGSGTTFLGLSPWALCGGALMLLALAIAMILLLGGGDGEPIEAVEVTPQPTDDDTNETRVDEDDADQNEARVDEADTDTEPDDETTDAGADESSDDTSTGQDDVPPPPGWISLGGAAPTFLNFTDGNQVGALAIDRGEDAVVVWWVPALFGLEDLHFQSRTGELVQAGSVGLPNGVLNGEVVEGAPFHRCDDGGSLWLTALDLGQVRVAALASTTEQPFETPFADLPVTSLEDLFAGAADGAEPATFTLDAFDECSPLVGVDGIILEPLGS